MAEKPLASNITCHAFNHDGTQVALSPNSHEIWIYETKGDQNTAHWEKKHVLSEHVGHVCSIDWCHITNQIVTCGHDRNAYVWTLKDDKWEPELVILRINRAAVQVKWSPSGKKFAVTSGMKGVPVCHYEKQNNWWVSKMIKKHKSTVLSVAWAPTNNLIVTGSSDNKCRVFSAYFANIDEKNEDALADIFPDQHKFGDLLAEFDVGKSWIHSVSWSPNALRMAFAAHGSSLHFVHFGAGGAHNVQTVLHKGLPFLDIKHLSNNTIVGVGYDYNPTIFHAAGEESDSAWSLTEALDKGDKAEKKQTGQSAFDKSRQLFVNSTDKGIQADSKVVETVLNTRHQNTINTVWVQKTDGKPTLLSTSSLDGHIYFWDISGLNL